MHPFSTAWIVLVLASGVAAAAEKPKPGPEVLVVADALQSEAGDFRPSPGKPVYYVMAKTQLTIGEVVAGVKMPDPAAVERAVVAALASQGFVRTHVGGPMPAICLLVMWGDANFADLDPPADPANADATAARDMFQKTRALTRDRRKAENLVGTDRIVSVPSPEGNKIAAASNEDRLYVSLAALDALAFAQKKKRLLWRTNMTVDGRNQLLDALPIMLASAAPFFGRHAATPVFIDDAARRKAKVEIGELKVVNDAASAEPATGTKK